MRLFLKLAASRIDSKREAPRSAPPQLEKKTSILSKFHEYSKSFDDDHVMKSFRARTELLLTKYEEIDEVSHDEFLDSSDEENSGQGGRIDKGKEQTRFVHCCQVILMV